jgi:hypothetical protein
MDISADRVSQTIQARQVADGERIGTLPRHFGKHLLRVEDAVYGFLREFAADYSGGYWNFYELSNGGFYMAPEGPSLRLSIESNGYEGEMSADAAGITVCLFALSHLSFQIRNDTIPRHFYQLRDFAVEHAESAAILAAID